MGLAVRATTGLMAAVTLLTACSTTTGDRASRATTTTTLATGSTLSTSSSSSTTTAPPATPPSGPTTTWPASSPEGHALALYAAWASGDRAAATRVAEPAAVEALFARPWQAGDGWDFAGCSGAAGSVICTWGRPAGQQLLLRVQNSIGALPVTVSEVRFQP